MRFLLATALAVFALAAHAQEAPRTITVSGEGEAVATPDMALITLGALSEADTAAEALRATSVAVAAALQVLEDAGIEARDIQTSGVSLSPRMVWPENGRGEPPRVVGYVASNDVTVRVRDLAALGGVIDAVVSAGANSLSGIAFTLSDPASARDEARRAAVADARARAELYADAAGVALGPLREIVEEGFSQPMPRMMAEAAMADAAAPVAPGELTISARVRMVYAIAE